MLLHEPAMGEPPRDLGGLSSLEWTLEGLRQALDQFLNQTQAAVTSLTDWLAQLGPAPWILMGLSATLAAAELARLRRRRLEEPLPTDWMRPLKHRDSSVPFTAFPFSSRISLRRLICRPPMDQPCSRISCHKETPR